MELIATCTFGLEKLVRNELKNLGMWIASVEDGKITFEADEEGLIKTNLCSRMASRIQMKVGEFDAKTFDELFDAISTFKWENCIEASDRFPVQATSVKSLLHSEPAIQSIVKKAVVKRLQKAYGTDFLPENSNALYQIVIKCNKDHFTASIDTSGEALHKRGYRASANAAPMKETLAAAMINLSDWDQNRTLIDPFCGSGTIPIEAALIAKKTAAGLNREFAFEKWPWIPQDKTKKIRDELRAAQVTEVMPKIFAFDIDPDTIEIAKENARIAGVDDIIVFRCVDFNNLDFRNFKNCTFVTNPPYGERLEEAAGVTKMYQAFGEKFRQTKDCSLFLITSRQDFPRLFGRLEDKNRKLFNGNLKCYLYEYR